MKRKFSRTVLVLTVICAMALIAAGSAGASGQIKAGTYPALISGNGTIYFAHGTGPVGECATGEGSSLGSNKVIASLTATMEVGACSEWGGKKPTFATNGCTFKWTDGNQLNADEGEGSQMINCPAGQQIEIARPTYKCSYTAGSQPAAQRVTFANKGEGTLNIGLNVPLTVKIVESGLPSQCGGSVGGTTTVSLWGTVALHAAQLNGTPTSLATAPVGFRVAGKESGTPAEQPHFVSDLAGEPFELSGVDQSGTAASWTFGSLGVRSLSCASTLLSNFVGTPAELPLSATYSNCSSLPSEGGEGKSTVEMNSCGYKLRALNVGPPYAANTEISCSTPGDGIAIKIWPKATSETPACSYRLKPQVLEQTAALSNLVSAPFEGVKASWTGAPAMAEVLIGTAARCGQKAGLTVKTYYTSKVELFG